MGDGRGKKREGGVSADAETYLTSALVRALIGCSANTVVKRALWHNLERVYAVVGRRRYRVFSVAEYRLLSSSGVNPPIVCADLLNRILRSDDPRAEAVRNSMPANVIGMLSSHVVGSETVSSGLGGDDPRGCAAYILSGGYGLLWREVAERFGVSECASHGIARRWADHNDAPWPPKKCIDFGSDEFDCGIEYGRSIGLFDGLGASPIPYASSGEVAFYIRHVLRANPELTAKRIGVSKRVITGRCQQFRKDNPSKVTSRDRWGGNRDRIRRHCIAKGYISPEEIEPGFLAASEMPEWSLLYYMRFNRRVMPTEFAAKYGSQYVRAFATAQQRWKRDGLPTDDSRRLWWPNSVWSRHRAECIKRGWVRAESRVEALPPRANSQQIAPWLAAIGFGVEKVRRRLGLRESSLRECELTKRVDDPEACEFWAIQRGAVKRAELPIHSKMPRHRTALAFYYGAGYCGFGIDGMADRVGYPRAFAAELVRFVSDRVGLPADPFDNKEWFVRHFSDAREDCITLRWFDSEETKTMGWGARSG